MLDLYFTKKWAPFSFETHVLHDSRARRIPSAFTEPCFMLLLAIPC